MLHCKKMCTKSQKGSNQKRSIGVELPQNVCNKAVKVETNNELCRVCLKQGTIPIHRDNPSEDLTDAITTFGGIEINISDSYPKYLCQSCFSLLQGAILFKKTAQESDECLKKSTEPKLEVDNDFSDSAYDNDTESFISTKEQKTVTHLVICKQCDLEFKTFQEYNDHTLTDEHGNQKKTCSICNKTYSSAYFKKHMKIHQQETAYICDVCGKHFVLQNQFTRHRLTHFYSLPFKCSLCPYKGRFTESLKMHMRSHTGEKPYICEECPQRFITKSNLNKHMLTHKKERDFVCECGRGYYTKREFDLHFKVEHAGIKEHVCPICGKAFGYRKQMMKHQLKVHKREKLKFGRMPIYLKVESMKQQQDQQENNMPMT